MGVAPVLWQAIRAGVHTIPTSTRTPTRGMGTRFATCVRLRELARNTGTRLRVRCAGSSVNFSPMGIPGHPDTTEHTVGATQMTDMATTYNPEFDESRERLVTS